ncbi:flagellar hook protein FlgE [Paraburkholderia jirisanensis]
MSYQQGLSGLAAATNDLDVIGNNIANAQTVGFKQSTAVFADMYANSVATAVNNQIGIGTRLAGVQQDFSQGQVTTTAVATNIAINGNGFFVMQNPSGAITYSRNGQMVPDKNGFITDAEGDKLMGYSANAQGVLQTTNVVPIQIPNINLPPVATTTITAGVNLNAQMALPTVTPFNAGDQNSFSYHTAVPSFDSLGGQSTVDLYFVKTATGQFEVFGGPSGTTPKDLGQMSFDSSGNLTSTTSGGAPTAISGQFSLDVTNTDGSAPQTIAIDVSSTTQFGSPNGINNLTADGFGSSTLANYSIGNDGTITGTYTDGRTATLGQVLLATFNDPNGLDNLGNNQFAATAASGVPQVSTPGSTNHGSVQGSATESSNVDLTGSLVDLITAQRNYQANAQTIKTQQTIDQTLINL